MSLPRTRYLCALTVVTLLAACSDGRAAAGPRAQDAQDALSPSTPSYTKGTNVSTLLGRATFGNADQEGDQKGDHEGNHEDGNLRITRETGDWRFDLRSKPFDIAVQTIAFAPGATSGWHSHPGPVFIQVTSGTMTFYMSDDPTCTPVVRTAGQGYLDLGDHSHIARNETTLPAQNVVTYFAPPGATLRIDQPAPGNCPF
jgi:hypothetical protein